jgi:ribonuclease G
MSDVLLVSTTGQETRLALIENGVLAELYHERQSERGIVGNIYKGKVVRVLPGMQAAFVDIGTDRAAFLYVSEVLNEHSGFSFEEDDEENEGAEVLDEEGEEGAEGDADADPEAPAEGKDDAAPPRSSGRRRARSKARIEDLLKEGQELLVQAAKDPIGTKGARLTCHITLPGRHLVFMPTVDHVGISRRITADGERKRLRALVDEMRPEGSGFIVRTAAANERSEHLRADMGVLIATWQQVLEKRDKVRAPALLHTDFDLVLRATRDLVSTNVDHIVVDSDDHFERIPKFIRQCMPGFYCKVEHYQGSRPIFEAYGIEAEIAKSLQRKVWLASGGYLIIDQTEALTAIDVNSGKYVGKSDLEDTITKINLEAAEEVVYQLRLRNIGGLIIIDFIDMDSKENRDKVNAALLKASEKDKTRSNVLKISDFGLVEMTRKRVKENLLQQLCEPCPYCRGDGWVKSPATIAYEILRKLDRELETRRPAKVELKAHPDVYEYIRQYEGRHIAALEDQTGVQINLRSSRALHKEEYELASKGDAPGGRGKGPAASESRGREDVGSNGEDTAFDGEDSDSTELSAVNGGNGQRREGRSRRGRRGGRGRRDSGASASPASPTSSGSEAAEPLEFVAGGDAADPEGSAMASVDVGTASDAATRGDASPEADMEPVTDGASSTSGGDEGQGEQSDVSAALTAAPAADGQNSSAS